MNHWTMLRSQVEFPSRIFADFHEPDRRINMRRYLVYPFVLVVMSLMTIIGATTSYSQELLTKNCTELITLAQTLEADLKTVDTVLGTAIKAGAMDTIVKYKLKKATVVKNLQSVLTAIDVKSCIKNK